jgi:hypothetical protein
MISFITIYLQHHFWPFSNIELNYHAVCSFSQWVVVEILIFGLILFSTPTGIRSTGHRRDFKPTTSVGEKLCIPLHLQCRQDSLLSVRVIKAMKLSGIDLFLCINQEGMETNVTGWPCHLIWFAILSMTLRTVAPWRRPSTICQFLALFRLMLRFKLIDVKSLADSTIYGGSRTYRCVPHERI